MYNVTSCLVPCSFYGGLPIEGIFLQRGFPFRGEGVSVKGGVSVQGEGLCPEWRVSVQKGGSLSRKEGLFPGGDP